MTGIQLQINQAISLISPPPPSRHPYSTHTDTYTDLQTHTHTLTDTHTCTQTPHCYIKPKALSALPPPPPPPTFNASTGLPDPGKRCVCF